MGMVGGGIITELWGWRWIFFVNVPVAALMLPAAARVLEESRDPAGPRRVDALGALLVTCGLVALIYAMTSVPEHGWRSATFLGGGPLGLALLAGFVAVETRHPDPLVPLRAVRRRAVLVPNAAIAFQSMVGIAWLYLLTLYFQEVLHEGALKTGLLFAPMTLASVVAAPLAGRLVHRIGLRTTAVAGLVMVSGGVGIMIMGLTPVGPLAAVLGGMVIGEAGFMLANVALTVAGTSELDDAQSGLAAGLLNTSMQLGSGWGLGVVAVVVAAELPNGAAGGEAYTTALRWGLFACICFSVLALALVAGGLRPRVAREP
jgi:MFS family permease